MDCSPTGTGVSARAVLLHARKKISENQYFVVESILGTCFRGRILKRLPYGPYEAVIPDITGSSSIIARNKLLIDPVDRLGSGFLLR